MSDADTLFWRNGQPQIWHASPVCSNADVVRSIFAAWEREAYPAWADEYRELADGAAPPQRARQDERT
jgi:hypothetical protein